MDSGGANCEAGENVKVVSKPSIEGGTCGRDNPGLDDPGWDSHSSSHRDGRQDDEQDDVHKVFKPRAVSSYPNSDILSESSSDGFDSDSSSTTPVDRHRNATMPGGLDEVVKDTDRDDSGIVTTVSSPIRGVKVTQSLPSSLPSSIPMVAIEEPLQAQQPLKLSRSSSCTELQTKIPVTEVLLKPSSKAERIEQVMPNTSCPNPEDSTFSEEWLVQAEEPAVKDDCPTHSVGDRVLGRYILPRRHFFNPDSEWVTGYSLLPLRRSTTRIDSGSFVCIPMVVRTRFLPSDNYLIPFVAHSE